MENERTDENKVPETKPEEVKSGEKKAEKPHTHKTHHEHHRHKKKKDIWKGLSAILALLFIAALVTKGFTTTGLNGVDEVKKVNAAEAAAKGVKYINNNLLQPGTAAKLVNVSELETVYSIKMEIGGREFESFITKDGKYLFPSGVDMDEPVEMPEEPATNIPKSSVPKVQLFVMSQCPFGTIGEAAIRPVVDLLGEKIDFELNYIATDLGGGNFNSLHGQSEIDGNIRQLCVEKHYPEKHMDYLACVNKNYRELDKQWENCAIGQGMDTETIETCWKEGEGAELLSENVKKAEASGVRSSPTLLINGSPYSGQRTPEAYKQAVCSAFTTSPEECIKELSTEGEAATGSC